MKARSGRPSHMTTCWRVLVLTAHAFKYVVCFEHTHRGCFGHIESALAHSFVLQLAVNEAARFEWNLMNASSTSTLSPSMKMICSRRGTSAMWRTSPRGRELQEVPQGIMKKLTSQQALVRLLWLRHQQRGGEEDLQEVPSKHHSVVVACHHLTTSSGIDCCAWDNKEERYQSSEQGKKVTASMIQWFTGGVRSILAA